MTSSRASRHRVDGDRLVVEGLHLDHPRSACASLLDIVIHVDADDEDLRRWFLERFRRLRAAAADDPDAFLHPFRDMPAEVIEGMALDVWRDVNLVVLHEEIRPWASAADLVVHFDGRPRHRHDRFSHLIVGLERPDQVQEPGRGGAADGDRTRVICLEGRGSAIELRPRGAGRQR